MYLIFLLPRSNYPYQLSYKQLLIDVDATRICEEFLSTFESFQVNLITTSEDYALLWTVSVICGKWRARSRPFMTFKHILVVTNTSTVVCNICGKRITTGWFKMISTITFIRVFKLRIMLNDFNIVSNMNFSIFLMHQLPNL